MWPSSLGLPTQHFLRFAGQLQVQRNRQQKASHSRKIKTQLPEKKSWIPICPQIATKIKPHLLQKYVSPYFMHRLPKYKRTNQVNGVCKIMSAFTSTLRSLDSGWQGWCIPSRLTSLIVCCSSFCFGWRSTVLPADLYTWTSHWYIKMFTICFLPDYKKCARLGICK